jgi:hypothetical protein
MVQGGLPLVAHQWGQYVQPNKYSYYATSCQHEQQAYKLLYIRKVFLREL